MENLHLIGDKPVDLGNATFGHDANGSRSPGAESGGKLSLWQAAAHADHAERGFLPLKRCRFFLRACRHPRLTHQWVDCLQGDEVRPLWQLQPRLAGKLQRPYLLCHWNEQERCEALLQHYGLLPQLIGAASLERIYRNGLPLLRLQCQGSGQQLELQLGYESRFEKEGELVLSLRDKAQNLRMAIASFSLLQQGGRRILMVGGLQAIRNEQMAQLIHDTMKKSLYAMRPKALVFWCLQQFAKVWGVEEIRAVGSSGHIYNHRHKRRELAADYDQFWQECEGQYVEQQLYWRLPLENRERARHELKPSRRKQHELRYLFLQGLREELIAGLVRHQPGSDPSYPEMAVPIFCYGQGQAAEPARGVHDQVLDKT